MGGIFLFNRLDRKEKSWYTSKKDLEEEL